MDKYHGDVHRYNADKIGLELGLIAFSTNNVIGTHTNAVVCVIHSNPIPLYSVWPDIFAFVHYKKIMSRGRDIYIYSIHVVWI